MYLPRFSHFFFFVTTFILAILTAHWYNGYDAAKQDGYEGSYIEFVKQESKSTYSGLKELPQITQEAYQSGDDITIGSMNRLSSVLEMYQMDNNEYPRRIGDLVGEYLSEKNTLYQQESFYYHRKLNGYEMGVRLPVSGKMFVIRQ